MDEEAAGERIARASSVTPRVPGAALHLSVVDPVAGAFFDVAVGRGYTDVPFEMLGRAAVF